MVKTKRTILIILLSFIAVISLTVGGVFAYFSATAGNGSKTLSTEITTDGDGVFTKTITGFSDLFTASKAEYWSDLSEVSTADSNVTYNNNNTTEDTTDDETVSTSRKVLKLGADVTLENDLFITADVHIDLNGYTLNLNGYTLTIAHSYAGTFLLYNGTKTDTTDESGNTTSTYGGKIISYTKETGDAASTTVTSDGATVNITLSDGTAIAVTTATPSATVTVTDETATAPTATVSKATDSSDSTKTNYTITYTYNSVNYTITTTVTTTSTTTDGTTTTTYSVSKAEVTAEAYPAAYIVINTPNALVDYSGVTIDTTSYEGKAVTVKNFGKNGTSDAAYLAYSALYYVGEELASTIETRPDMLTYSEFTDSSGNYSAITPSLFAITPSLFLAGKECDGSTTEYCAYVAAGKDLILPEKYLSTDYKITYSFTAAAESSATISSKGNVGSSAGDGTLEAAITVGDNTYSVTFTVHVVSSGDSTAAKVLIKSYLSKYKTKDSADVINGSDVTIKEGDEFYMFSSAVQLPIKDDELDIEYSYTLYNTKDDNGYNEYESDSSYYVPSKNKRETGADRDDVAYLLNTAFVNSYLGITCNGAESPDVYLTIFSASISYTESAAYLFLTAFYGNSIVYDGEEVSLKTTANIEEISDDELVKKLGAGGGYAIESVKYEIVVTDDGGNLLKEDENGNELDAYNYYQINSVFTDENKITYTISAITDKKGTTTYSVAISGLGDDGTGKATRTATKTDTGYKIDPYEYNGTSYDSVTVTEDSSTKYTLSTKNGVANSELPISTGTIKCTVTTADGGTDSMELKIIFASSGSGTDSYMDKYNRYSTDVMSPTYRSFTMPFTTDGVYTLYEFMDSYYEKSGEGSITLTAGTDGYYDFAYYVTNGTDNYTYSALTEITYSAPTAISVSLVTSTKTTDADGNETTTYEILATFAYTSNTSTSIPVLKQTITTSGTTTYKYAEVTDIYKKASISAAFDSWLSATYSDLSAIPTTAVWLINIDADELSYDDDDMLIVYKYKSSASETSWTTYSQKFYKSNGTDEGINYITTTNVSALTLTGGVHLDTKAAQDYDADGKYSENGGYYANNVIVDQVLFNYMKAVFDDGTDTFIPNSALERSATLDVTLTYNYNYPSEVYSETSTETEYIEGTVDFSSIEEWWGIQHLSGLTEVNLSDVDLSGFDVNDFNYLKSVQTLTLRNCKLTETNLVKTTTDDEGNITYTFLTLSNLRELDISNDSGSTANLNGFTDFTWLLETIENGGTALQKVHIVNNKGDGTFTGSEGICNYYIYEELALDGVTVYNTVNSNGVEIPFSESTDLNDYRRLKSIAYQAILPEGVSIKKCYAEFEYLTTDLLNMENTYSDPTITWTYGGGKDDADAEWFQASVTAVDSSGEHEIIARFHVDRKKTSSTTSSSTGGDTSGSTGTDENNSSS